jgi:Protein of unknown function (DUF2975)
MQRVAKGNGSTIFLKGVVLLLGLAALAVCVFALPAGLSHDEVGGYRPIFAGMYLTAIPFFAALYQTLKLLHYIDANKAFSSLSVKALRNIKYCALTIGALYGAGLPYIYRVADTDDAPGVMALGLMITFAAVVVAVFAAVLQTLVRHAVAMKTENDLTV